MIKAAVIGIGKMGLSHLAILNANPEVSVVGVCDKTKYQTGMMKKLTDFRFYSDYEKMISKENPDCIVISTPSATHSKIVDYCLSKGLHVFVEKPFCLNIEDSKRLALKAEQLNLVNQVGYHNKFVGTFQKVKELLDDGVIGELYYIHGEAYGPVVLKEKGSTWRTRKSEGGGCIHDYASHVIDLMNYYVGLPSMAVGTDAKRIFSSEVEDAVYSTFMYSSGLTGRLSVNWSEKSYRKMSTSITLEGKKGKIVVDRQECRLFLNQPDEALGLEEGWTVFYITDFENNCSFYLRGEEYSKQMQHFSDCVSGKEKCFLNSFRSACDTDITIEMILQDDGNRGQK